VFCSTVQKLPDDRKETAATIQNAFAMSRQHRHDREKLIRLFLMMSPSHSKLLLQYCVIVVPNSSFPNKKKTIRSMVRCTLLTLNEGLYSNPNLYCTISVTEISQSAMQSLPGLTLPSKSLPPKYLPSLHPESLNLLYKSFLALTKCHPKYLPSYILNP